MADKEQDMQKAAQYVNGLSGNIPARLGRLATDAKVAAEPHLSAIQASLRTIDQELEALRALGLSVDVNWPFGRGAAAKATSTRVNCSMRVDF